jgi:L-aspartate oxidase
MVYKYDFLVIGAGVAGMSYALKVARAKKGRVCMICKTSLDEANTSFAQGGVASVTNLKVDTFDKHIADTIIAGDYISDRKAVEQVVRNAPEQIKEMVELPLRHAALFKAIGVKVSILGSVSPEYLW